MTAGMEKCTGILDGDNSVQPAATFFASIKLEKRMLGSRGLHHGPLSVDRGKHA